MSASFLAFDLGAESGRAIAGTLRSGVLTLDEVHRFQNEPVRWNGALQWDILRLWLGMKRGLESAAGSGSKASEWGNITMQMLATGAVSSLAEGRTCPVVFAVWSPASHTIAFAQSAGRIGRRVMVRCA